MGFSEKKRFLEGANGTVGDRGEIIKAQTVNQKQVEVISQKNGSMVSEHQRKDWRKALVVYRNTMMLSWREFRKKIQAKLRRVVEVVSLAADRAIIWCLDEEEISSLLLNPFQFSNGKNQVRIERWNVFAHWDNLQIHVNHSWIGIEGLLINMWKFHVFKIIGKALGGLLEVAPETRSLSFLQYAIIKVGGLEGGFMDPIMETPYQGLKVSIGIFTIAKPKKLSAEGRTFGLLTRAVRAEDGCSGGGERQKEERARPAGLLQKTRSLFVLGSTKKSYVAERERKVSSVQSYKEILLSAVLEKGGREDEVGLIADSFSPFSHGQIEGRYGRFSKEGSILPAQSLEKMKHVNKGPSSYGLLPDSKYSKSKSMEALGMGEKSQKNPDCSEVGQAEDYLLSNHAQSGSDVITTETTTRRGYQLSSDKAQAQEVATGGLKVSIGPGPRKSFGTCALKIASGHGLGDTNGPYSVKHLDGLGSDMFCLIRNNLY